MARASPSDHMRYFTTFIAGILGTFSRYLKRPNVDIERDGVGYRQITLHLSDEELRSLAADLDARLRREAGNEPGAGRRPRVIARIFMPEEQPCDHE